MPRNLKPCNRTLTPHTDFHLKFFKSIDGGEVSLVGDFGGSFPREAGMDVAGVEIFLI